VPTVILVPIKWLYWAMLLLYGVGGLYVIVFQHNANGIVGLVLAAALVGCRRGLRRFGRSKRWRDFWDAPGDQGHLRRPAPHESSDGADRPASTSLATAEDAGQHDR
jgi:hypothetical protein